MAEPPRPRLPRFSGLAAGSPSPPVPPSANWSSSSIVPQKAPKPRRRFIAQLPREISADSALTHAISALPSNYNFEIPKTIWRLRQLNATSVALQFPEGLLIFATTIADILERFAGVSSVIMGDVTYGACCVDDLSAAALGCELLVHYGHSCLVPVDQMETDVLYVFVEIEIDTAHLIDSLRAAFSKEPFGPQTRLALCATIQFAGCLPAVRAALEPHLASVIVPQCKPLSAGETLGCTSPQLGSSVDAVAFVADGRFHPESVMIANPQVPLYRYDPYAKVLTHEIYEHARMHSLRRDAVLAAASAKRWGVVLGTLGRQGSPAVLSHLHAMLRRRGLPFVTVLLSEVFPAKLAAFPDVEAWVQICCPRLSVDWGHAFCKPLLSPYEAEVALGAAEWLAVYPMDYYSKDGGTWTNYADAGRRAATRERCARGCAGDGDCIEDKAQCEDAMRRRPRHVAADDSLEAFDRPTATCPPPSPPPSPPPLSPTCRGGEWQVVGATGQSAKKGKGCIATRASIHAEPLRETSWLNAQGEHAASYVLVDDGVRHGKGLVERCAALEKKCFAKHEAMDVAAETRGRGALLIVALAEAAQWPDIGAMRASSASDDTAGKATLPAVAGYLVLQRSSLSASVAKLVVAPAWRRRGIGRRLLLRAVELARANRAQVCTLHVDTNNAPAKALYQSAGFVVVGTRPDYYCAGRDAHSMELALVE